MIKLSELEEIGSSQLLANINAIIPVSTGNASLDTFKVTISNIGNYILSNANTIVASTLTVGNITSGNITVSGNLNSAALTSTGNITTNSRISASGGIQNTPIGNVTPSTAQFTTIGATGNIIVSELTANLSMTVGTTLSAAGGLQNTPIGNVTASTARFTTVSSTGNITAAALTSNGSITAGTSLNVAGGIQNTPIGNTTPSTAQFTVVSASGNLTAANLISNSSINALTMTLSGNATTGNANVRSNITVGNLTVRSNATMANASIGNLTVTTIGIHEWATAKTLVVGPQIDYIAVDTVGAGSPSPYEYSQCYIDTTGGPLTPSLTDGADEGFIKIFYMYFDGGNCTLTVESAAWKGGPSFSGTITFNDVGDTCTLMWNLGSWYILSSYGVTIA